MIVQIYRRHNNQNRLSHRPHQQQNPVPAERLVFTGDHSRYQKQRKGRAHEDKKHSCHKLFDAMPGFNFCQEHNFVNKACSNHKLNERLEHLDWNEHALVQKDELAYKKEEQLKALNVEDKLVECELFVGWFIKSSCADQEVDAKDNTRYEQEPLSEQVRGGFTYLMHSTINCRLKSNWKFLFTKLLWV